MTTKAKLLLIMLMSTFLLAACSTPEKKNNTSFSSSNSTTVDSSSEMEKMEGMNHGEQLPTSMIPAKNPKYSVGSGVVITEDHMLGMKGAEATIRAAYDTTIYEVTFSPTNGGKKIENHKWVVQEELKDTKNSASVGDQVTLQAAHTEGMMGAIATVDTFTTGTVYVVDYKPTNGKAIVKNHMWVTENELTPN